MEPFGLRLLRDPVSAESFYGNRQIGEKYLECESSLVIHFRRSVLGLLYLLGLEMRPNGEKRQ